MKIVWQSPHPPPRLPDGTALSIVTPATPQGSGAVDRADAASSGGVGGDLAVISTLTAEARQQAARQTATGTVCFLSTQPELEEAVEALRCGFADYLHLNDGLADDLVAAVERARTRWQVDDPRLLVDPVTRVASHAHLMETLSRRIAEAKRFARPLSIAVVNIDDFTALNERLGHTAGDGLLREVGTLLSGQHAGLRMRRSDMAGRLAADQFVLVLPDTDRRGAAVHANKARMFMERAGFGDSGDIRAKVSIGVATTADGSTTRAALLEQAQSALDAAKRRGKNRVVLFTEGLTAASAPDLSKAFQVEVELLQALEESLAKSMFWMAFQPLVDATTLTATAYEALTRPKHDAFPGPYQLFTTAERAGRVADLGRATRRLAVDALPQLEDGRSLFVNLHPLELNDDLAREAEDVLAPYADRMVLEITETAALPDSDYHRDLIKSLRSAGFRVALDDLGSGYAGLNSLSALQPDIVKLDMKLIRALDTEPATRRLVRHIIEFAREESMQVVAEGVETVEEARTAIDLGCHLLQGYYFAKPGPAFPEVVGKVP